MTPRIPPPSAEQQLVFLAKIQRLFAEGDFTATYKFALLIALADLAVEMGADDGAELNLSVRQIAERFIQLYWRHASPYSADRPGMATGVLKQNIGTQAAVVSQVAEFRSRHGVHTLPQARVLPEYASLLTRVAYIVSKQPLTYLQNFGGGTDPFIYERNDAGMVLLKTGVAYCLRRFQPLVQQLSRAHWVEHIKKNKRNSLILGEARDLEDFLFSSSRQSLTVVAEGLRKLDGNSCFYCGHQVTEAEVDHYVPFSLYPRDLAHNFVLAHSKCNRSKSDTLAARRHLERWLERLELRSDALAEIGLDAGISADATTSRKVAAWGYASASQAGASAWLHATQYETVIPEYIALFNNDASGLIV